jgi:hypothetical protein
MIEHPGIRRIYRRINEALFAERTELVVPGLIEAFVHATLTHPPRWVRGGGNLTPSEIKSGVLDSVAKEFDAAIAGGVGTTEARHDH